MYRFLPSNFFILKCFLQEEYKDVESFTGKTFKGDIQSVFVDSAGAQYKGLANKVANKIFTTLNSGILKA